MQYQITCTVRVNTETCIIIITTETGPHVRTRRRYLIRGVTFSSHTFRQWAILVLVSDGLGLYGGLPTSKAHNLLLSPPTHARRTANQCGGLISPDFLRGHHVPCNGVTMHRYIVTGTDFHRLKAWVGRGVALGRGVAWGEW